MVRKYILLLLLLSLSSYSFSQIKKTAIVKGKLLNAATKAPFNDLKIILPESDAFTTSDGDGNFEISEVPYGKQQIIITGYNAQNDTLSVLVDKEVVDLTDIKITPNDKGITIDNAEIPTISIAESNASGSDASDPGFTGGEELLVASRDPFVQTVVYIFGGYLFKARGERNQNETQINGITYNNALTNYLSWGQQLGNQTDVFRGRDVRYGLEPSPYTFGGINGSTYIQATAADFQKETKVSYTASDHTYKNRVMITSSTGLMKNGWAYTISANKQWATEGYRPGTFYNGYAYFAGASKVIGKHHFNLTTFGVPLQQASGYVATQEAYNLSKDNYYNSDWGYYTDAGGHTYKRTASIQNVFQPTTIFSYEYKPSDKTRWTTSLGYQFGKDKKSSIDDYNASSPYGNYYRNLPGYYYNMFPPDSVTGNQVKQQIMNNPNLLQINWNRLYAVNMINTQTMTNVNGIAGNSFTGRQSSYVLYDKVNDLKKYTFNTNVEHSVDQYLTLYGGLSFYTQTTEIYKQLTDLLGGDYFVNYNQFASQQYIGNPNYNQNNLNDPNQVIRVGDKYGYDYSIRMNNTLAFGQAVYSLDQFTFFAAVQVGDNAFNRDGYMRNGLFANNSYGKSSTTNFFTYAAKGGLTYKIDQRNMLFLNLAYTTTPPTVDNTYISASTRDFTVSNPTVQKNQSIEGGYLLQAQRMSARVVGYMNTSQDVTEIKRFYDDDPAYQTFVNYVLQHESTKSIGTELMLNYNLTRAISITGVAAIGKAIYANRPDINVFLDNDTLQHGSPSKSFIKNYYLPVGPQSAYTIGLNYKSKKYWYANLNFNYLDRNYVAINPNRRTEAAIDLVPQGSAQMAQILNQEELPAAFTVDLHAGKSFQLSRMSGLVNKTTGTNTILAITVGVNNLLNNTDVIVRGSEQLRYDFSYRNPNLFPNTYQYGYGINYYLNISLKF
jgi:hypothetical protein